MDHGLGSAMQNEDLMTERISHRQRVARTTSALIDEIAYCDDISQLTDAVTGLFDLYTKHADLKEIVHVIFSWSSTPSSSNPHQGVPPMDDFAHSRHYKLYFLQKGEDILGLPKLKKMMRESRKQAQPLKRRSLLRRTPPPRDNGIEATPGPQEDPDVGVPVHGGVDAPPPHQLFVDLKRFRLISIFSRAVRVEVHVITPGSQNRFGPKNSEQETTNSSMHLAETLIP
ncbi:hypothetical protein AAG570_011661 [Ranatra chinensis]|uniref:Uncharacterized protein n=1 Tax=Ranatra chinensis TaxID=642074 RepID=A0ABD0YGK7_9HEMI